MFNSMGLTESEMSKLRYIVQRLIRFTFQLLLRPSKAYLGLQNISRTSKETFPILGTHVGPNRMHSEPVCFLIIETIQRLCENRFKFNSFAMLPPNCINILTQIRLIIFDFYLIFGHFEALVGFLLVRNNFQKLLWGLLIVLNI